MEKIIKTKILESGITAICCETMQDNFSIEIARKVYMDRTPATNVAPIATTPIKTEEIQPLDNECDSAASCIFLHAEDIPGLISLLHDVDEYFLRK